jgi:sodium-dependent dicarboxylate transporter 2/3/5
MIVTVVRKGAGKVQPMLNIKTPLLILAVLVILFILFSPRPEGLTREGQGALAILAMCFILWTTAAIPLSVTSIVAIALLPLLGVMGESEAFSLFGNPAVFFILGAFILAGGMMASGLSSRLAVVFLRRFEKSPRRLLSGIILSCAFMALWMPAHAVAAFMFPIVLEIARALDLRPRESNYGKALFLSLAWGCVVGGVATLLGGARNALAIAILSEKYGMAISFRQWFMAVFPVTLILVAVVHLVVFRFFRPEIDDVRAARDVLERKVRELGRMSATEKKVLVVMLITVVFWVVLSERLGLAAIAILGASALFITHAMTWHDVEKYVNWGVILMYGGAIALAKALEITGAARWLVTSFLEPYQFGPFAMLAILSLISITLTEAMSNAAVVALVLPIAFELLDTGTQLSPIAAVFAVAVPAGLAFTLPIGTPPNAIAYSARYHRLRDSLRVGVLLNVVALLAFLVIARFYWPHLGIF